MQKTDIGTVIARTLELFRRQGYHKTTMADVAAACGLLKGSLYHYFPSKEALAKAVMDEVHARFARAVFACADEPGLGAEARLERMMAETEAYFLNGAGGCVIGNIALEAIDLIPDFAPAIRAYFREWTAAIARIMASRYPADQAERKAERAVAEIQGAIMMMRIYGDSAKLVQTTRGILAEFGS